MFGCCGSTSRYVERNFFFLTHDKEYDEYQKKNQIKFSLDCHQSRHALPFLPKSPKCLKTGQQAKVIAKGGRIVVGKIRYIGHIANDENEDEIYVGLEMSHAQGDSDGSFNGRKFFEW